MGVTPTPGAKSRLCAYSTCEIAVRPPIMFCRDHWLQLPAEIRVQVNRSYQRYARQKTRERLQDVAAARRAALEFFGLVPA